MMRLALLGGLFGVPAVLLWLGHRLRDRSPVEHGAFWGGVIGHSVALVVALAALHYPPVLWTGPVRMMIVFWIMIAGAAAGALMGAVRARAR
jgi:hypothetical protein